MSTRYGKTVLHCDVRGCKSTIEMEQKYPDDWEKMKVEFTFDASRSFNGDICPSCLVGFMDTISMMAVFK